MKNNLDIIPTYACNLKCPFCFNKDNWDTEGLLDLNILKRELANNPEIRELAIIGGEPSLLPDDYLKELIDICIKYLHGNKPDYYTNLTMIPDKHILDNINLHVSYDPCDRTCQDKVLSNMLQLDTDFSINMIITKKLITEYGVHKIIKLANRFKKTLYLSKINVVTTNGIKHMQPTPDEIISFTMELSKYNNPYIRSSLLRVLNGTYTHNKHTAERFDYNVSINPDGRFQTSGLHGIEKIYRDTYKECLKAYEEAFRTPKKCKQCRFNDYCIDEYRYGDDCTEDYKIMEAFERYKHEHLCNL